jgi:pimeloyl-ACP methyl ester carboxylesterase
MAWAWPVRAAHNGGGIGPSWHPLGRWLALDGVGRVHVVTVPCRDPHAATHPRDVLLIHGYLQSSWTWRQNLEALAAQLQVHAVCVPGFGWSDKPRHIGYSLPEQAARLWQVLDSLGVQQAHLVGNSLGGATALQMAVQAPARVGRLVLVNPAGHGLYPMAALASLQHELAEPLLHLPGIPTLLRLGLQYGAYANLDVDAAFLQRFLQPLQTAGAKRAALQVARHFNRDLRALDRRLGEVQAPALLMWGQGDRVVPLAAVQRLARALADARLELYDCSGHCPMEEEPRRFNRETLAFLSGHTASGACA